VVLPTYNNAATVTDIIHRSLKLAVPTYIVNDGSTDGTDRVLSSLDAPGLHILTHDRNRGKAAAMLTGFHAAAADGCSHAATVDTDGQLDPEQVPLLFEMASSNPSALVLGARDLKIAHCPTRSTVGRRLANLLIRIECGLCIEDSQCGLRVYPLRFITRTPIAAERYGFETEVIVRAGWAGTPVVQVPVACRYFQNPVSHFRPWMDTCRAIRMHARLLVRGFSRGHRARGAAGAPQGVPRPSRS
jgi:glycosyltransferase involved in cell wall biosynthesis